MLQTFYQRKVFLRLKTFGVLDFQITACKLISLIFQGGMLIGLLKCWLFYLLLNITAIFFLVVVFFHWVFLHPGFNKISGYFQSVLVAQFCLYPL